MVRQWLQRLVLLALFGALASIAQAETISRIRVMLHPYAAAPGELPAAALARLQTLAGISLSLAGTTRTGGLDFDLAQPLDRPTATALVCPPARRSQRAVGRAGLDRRLDPVAIDSRERCDHRTRRQADAAACRRSGPRLGESATALERAGRRPARRRPPGRQRLGSQAAGQGRPGAPWCHGLTAANRRRSPVRRSGAPGHG